MTGTFEGVGTLQFSPDNKRAYAYSGGVSTVAATDVTLLQFTTGSEYHIAKIQFWYDANGSGSNIEFKTSFNDVKITTIIVTDSNDAEWCTPVELIIPPFTTVHIEAKNFTGTEAVLASLTTKVKGAIEQQNLEAITDNSKWASK